MFNSQTTLEMTSLVRFSLFIILIERRAAAVLALLAASWMPLPAAHAAPAPSASKIARDLGDELSPVRAPRAPWARDLNGVRHVQAVLVVGESADAEMNELREHVRRLGGAVQAVHPAVRSMTVLLPAGQVAALAQHRDVVSIAPNRGTRRTASTLEKITGALGANVRTNSTQSTYTGLDGAGIGVAVLDSGVMRKHTAFNDPASRTTLSRVRRSVSMLSGSLANWTGGTAATSPMPGSTALANYEASIDNNAAANQDPYGHGTHVAGIIAGFARAYQFSPDTTGIAPNASIYDVKVLGDDGTGTVSDALEGIQWVIYHAKEYNIRVLNVSLAASSTQSWQTDPLCVAVRSATAAGITVVVAAGNFALDAQGRETYGTVSAPGNDPSVITVGSVNFHGTVARGDDTVNNFSSRGPTRGALVDASGVRRIDNLLKPDLVAPGNKLVAPGSSGPMLPIVTSRGTSYSSINFTWNTLASTYKDALVTPLAIAQNYGETQCCSAARRSRPPRSPAPPR